MPTPAVIFDMDGVLIDSEPAHFVAANDVLAEHGCALTEADNEAYLGWNEPRYWAALIERFGLPGGTDHYIRVRHERLVELLKEDVRVMPGVLGCLAALAARGTPLAVASSSERELIDFVLAEGGFASYFGVVASGDEVASSKPDPEIFLLAAERLGREPAACIVFEDSVNGVLAARAAGMACVRVVTRTTRDLEFPEVDHVVEGFVGVDVDEILRLQRVRR